MDQVWGEGTRTCGLVDPRRQMKEIPLTVDVRGFEIEWFECLDPVTLGVQGSRYQQPFHLSSF